jgi:thioredoxin-related protein
MKTLALAILLLLSAVVVRADEYNDTLAAARKSDKHIILFFYSTTCPYCDLMEKETLTERETTALMRQIVLFLRLDGDKRRDLARLYGVRAYPTMWLLDPTGARVGQVPGYVSRPDFHTILSYLKGRHYRHSDLPTYGRRQGR